jgi:hypothetical protein
MSKVAIFNHSDFVRPQRRRKGKRIIEKKKKIIRERKKKIVRERRRRSQ